LLNDLLRARGCGWTRVVQPSRRGPPPPSLEETMLVLHDDLDDGLGRVGHGGRGLHVAGGDGDGLLALAQLDALVHGALAGAGGRPVVHPGVDVLQVAEVGFVQGDLQGELHAVEVVVERVGEEDGQGEGVRLVHQHPHAAPEVVGGVGEAAALGGTRWDPGAGWGGAVAAEAVVPGRREEEEEGWGGHLGLAGRRSHHWEMV